MKITTKLECVGWIAWDADNCDEGMAQGIGKTELAAINELVEKLVERIETRYQKRLEVLPGVKLDGIDARDETIRLLERELAETQTRVAVLERLALDTETRAKDAEQGAIPQREARDAFMRILDEVAEEWLDRLDKYPPLPEAPKEGTNG